MTISANINTTQKYVRDIVSLGDGRFAVRYSIALSPWVDYVVWEPSQLGGKHSTLTHLEGQQGWFGRMTTRGLTPALDALPAYSEERSKAVRAFFKDLEAEEERIIHSLWPNDFKEGATL